MNSRIGGFTERSEPEPRQVERALRRIEEVKNELREVVGALRERLQSVLAVETNKDQGQLPPATPRLITVPLAESLEEKAGAIKGAIEELKIITALIELP